MNKTLIINPGSEGIEDATEQNAMDNMKHYIADCEVDDLSFVRIPQKDYGDGRFAFLIWKGTRCHEIQIPGLPLDKVRYVGSKGQNIWDYPRLYIDDGSLIWKFAIRHEKDFKEVEK